MASHSQLRVISALALPALILAGCSAAPESSTVTGTTLTVTASDTACTLDTTTAPSGAVSFNVTNSGNEVTEVYVYAESDEGFSSVVSEVENIGPGVTRDMSAELAPGTYEVACKPGQTGDGIRTQLSITGEALATTSTPVATAAREISLSIDSSDHLAGLGAETATSGERIVFEVKNNAPDSRVFEIKRPDGTVAGEIDIKAGQDADLYVDMTTPGNWLLIVEGGPTETETEFVVQ